MPTRLPPSPSARSRRRSVSACRSPRRGETPTVDADDEDYETEEKEIDYRFVDTDDDGILLPFAKGKPGPSDADRERLERVLQDLVACRQLLDNALKDG